MKVSGERTVAAGRKQLWDALHDPELLRRALPGCSQLDRAGSGRYAVTIRVGIPCVRGDYRGDLEVVERTAPSSLTLAASGAGEQGSGRGRVTIDLHETDAGTRVRYDVDAEVAGAISRVGQRLLTSAVDRTVADHLDAVAQACAGGVIAPTAASTAAGPPHAEAEGSRAGGAVEQGPGTVRDAPEEIRRIARLGLTQKQAATAAAIASALVGFLVGRRSRR